MPEPKPSTRQRLREWATSNLLSVLGILALLVYVALRVPAEIFYGHLGVSADAAGFSDINVVLQRSVQLLVIYTLVGAAWATAVFVLSFPPLVTAGTVKLKEEWGSRKIWIAWLVPFGISLLFLPISFGNPMPWLAIAAPLAVLNFFLPRILFAGAAEERRQARREAWGTSGIWMLAGLGFGVFMFLTLSITEASRYADDVKKGIVSDSPLYPWREHRVTVTWKTDTPPIELPDCKNLTYLGEDGSRVLLYDSKKLRALRLNSADVELIYPDHC